jgi:hypothetical protein
MSSEESTGYSAVAVIISAIGGIIVAFVSVWIVSFLWGGGDTVIWEQLFRVGPTVEGGGIGTDWVNGNTIPALDFLIAITHAADVILGVFILLMVFIHWASFRRLAGQMRGTTPAGGSEEVAADGGTKQMEGNGEQEQPMEMNGEGENGGDRE